MVPFLAAACGGVGARVGQPVKTPVVVPLDGPASGVATLRRVDGGQKTSVEVRLRDGPVHVDRTVQLARGSCRRPTALTSPTVLGGMHDLDASWTVPTPYEQLANGRALAVVVRSPDHAVEACGNAPF